MSDRRKAPYTWTEIIVASSVLAVLLLGIGIFILTRTQHSTGDNMLSRMKQLHLATQSMALDGTTTGDTNLAWPGTRDGTFTTWAHNIVPSYIGTNDFSRLISGMKGAVAYPTENTNSILVYGVTEEQDGSYVFLTSANFTNTPAGGAPLLPGAQPYGDKGFAVFRKGGDGAILLPNQVGDTNVIGLYTPLLR